MRRTWRGSSQALCGSRCMYRRRSPLRLSRHAFPASDTASKGPTQLMPLSASADFYVLACYVEAGSRAAAP